jgi:uncharacterized protein
MDDMRPLSETELDRLDQALARRPAALGEMTLSAADGFICAAAISPEFLAPREWMAALFGDADAGAFADKGEAADIHALAWRRRNAIVAALQTDGFEPLFEFDADGWAIGEIWAEGFLDAMALRLESWAPILDDATGAALILPVMALGDPDTLAQIEPRKAKRATMAARLTGQIKLAIPTLARVTAALRDGRPMADALPDASVLAALAQPANQPTSVAQIGRNDPCPCGSGKKHKRCCGATA